MNKLMMLPFLAWSLESLPMSVEEKIQKVWEECGLSDTKKEAQELVIKAAKHDKQAQHTTGTLFPIVAPWRDSYKTAERTAVPSAEKPKKEECPFCNQCSTPDKDRDNFILERNNHSVTMFNRSPYLPLHFLMVPFRHIAQWNQLTFDERQELLERAIVWRKKLEELGIGGANFYFNLESKSAGASLPDHLHGQFLSRWDGDRSAITYLLGKTLIARERDMCCLLPEFYTVAQTDKSDKLASVFGLYADILSAQKTGASAASPTNCYVCEVEAEKNDEENLIVKRTKNWLVLLHRFGYSGGHLRIVSRQHDTSLARLNQEESNELAETMNCSQTALKKAVSLDGLNMVISDGKCSDTPFDGHVTCDVIPRIINGTSSTAVVCGRPIMEKDVDRLYEIFTRELQ